MRGKGLYFLDDFIIPSLDNKRFPSLSWIDRDEKLYKVMWPHKGSHSWRENDFHIFSEWDKLKGNYHPEIPEYWTLAKQRFRNAHSKLEKMGRVKREKVNESKGFRVYRITDLIDPRPQQTYCNSPDLLTKQEDNVVVVNPLPIIQPVELYLACEEGIFPIKLESPEIVIDTGCDNTISTEHLEESAIKNSDGLKKEACLDNDPQSTCTDHPPENLNDAALNYQQDWRVKDVDPVMSTGCEGDKNPNLLFQTCGSNNVEHSKDNVLDTESQTLSFYDFMDDESEDFSGENWQLPLEDLIDTENMMEVFGDLETMEMNEKDQPETSTLVQ